MDILWAYDIEFSLSPYISAYMCRASLFIKISDNEIINRVFALITPNVIAYVAVIIGGAIWISAIM